MAHDVFLSYSRADMELALKIVSELRARGVDIWYDAMIPGGDDWRDEIVDNLGQSRAMVILFSRHSNDSIQLKKELAVADSLRIKVMPVLVDKVEPRGHYLYELASRQWINLSETPEARIPELGERLADLLQIAVPARRAEPIPAEAPPAVERVQSRPARPAQQPAAPKPAPAPAAPASSAGTASQSAPARRFSAFRPKADSLLTIVFTFFIAMSAAALTGRPITQSEEYTAVLVVAVAILIFTIWPIRWASAEADGGGLWRWKWLRRAVMYAAIGAVIFASVCNYLGLSSAVGFSVFLVIGFVVSAGSYAAARRSFELRRFHRPLNQG